MPKRKVVDIISPQKKTQKIEASLSSKKDSPLLVAKKLESKPFFKGKRGLIGIGGLFLFAFAFCYLTLSKAEVLVWPEAQVIKIEAEVTIDKNAEEIVFASNIIPGAFIEKEMAVKETFSATGKATKEGKAEGIIRVYNEFSTSPQILIATTRFISTEGKVFRTPSRVVISGGKYENGKFVPGYTDIKVVADQPGSEYNISPSTFSIPGFAGTARYTKFYAKSSKTMSGGFITGASLITKEDVEKAKGAVNEKAKTDCESLFKEEFSSNNEIVFFESAMQNDIVNESSSAPSGTEAEKFNFESKARTKTLSFKRADLESFVREALLSQSPEGYKIYEESLKIDYEPKTVSLNLGKMVISLIVSSTLHLDIDTESLKKSVSGKSLAGSKLFLENQQGIVKTEVNFWPFWVKKAPRDLEKIKIELKID